VLAIEIIGSITYLASINDRTAS